MTTTRLAHTPHSSTKNVFTTIEIFKKNKQENPVIQYISTHNPFSSTGNLSFIATTKDIKEGSSCLLQKAGITLAYSATCSAIIYPVDKLNFYFQTSPFNLTWQGAFSRFCHNAINGLGAHIVSTAIKNFCTFVMKDGISDSLIAAFPEMNKKANNAISGFVSGLLTTYLLSPLFVIKTQAMLDKPLRHITKELPFKAYYNGVHCKAITDAVFVSVFFSIMCILSEQFPENNSDDQSAWLRQGLIGGASGVAAGFVSNPIAVVTTNLRSKNKPESAIKVIKELYSAKGLIHGFWPKFFGTTSLRMIIQGIVLGSMVKSLENLKPNDQNKKNMIEDKEKAKNLTHQFK